MWIVFVQEGFAVPEGVADGQVAELNDEEY
jgi:hypothetical protein